MIDIVEWLERFAVYQECDDPMTNAGDAMFLREAAAEITRLRARVAELESQTLESRARAALGDPKSLFSRVASLPWLRFLLVWVKAVAFGANIVYA